MTYYLAGSARLPIHSSLLYLDRYLGHLVYIAFLIDILQPYLDLASSGIPHYLGIPRLVG